MRTLWEIVGQTYFPQRYALKLDIFRVNLQHFVETQDRKHMYWLSDIIMVFFKRKLNKVYLKLSNTLRATSYESAEKKYVYIVEAPNGKNMEIVLLR